MRFAAFLFALVATSFAGATVTITITPPAFNAPTYSKTAKLLPGRTVTVNLTSTAFSDASVYADGLTVITGTHYLSLSRARYSFNCGGYAEEPGYAAVLLNGLTFTLNNPRDSGTREINSLCEPGNVVTTTIGRYVRGKPTPIACAIWSGPLAGMIAAFESDVPQGRVQGLEWLIDNPYFRVPAMSVFSIAYKFIGSIDNPQLQYVPFDVDGSLPDNLDWLDLSDAGGTSSPLTSTIYLHYSDISWESNSTLAVTQIFPPTTLPNPSPSADPDHTLPGFACEQIFGIGTINMTYPVRRYLIEQPTVLSIKVTSEIITLTTVDTFALSRTPQGALAVQTLGHNYEFLPSFVTSRTPIALARELINLDPNAILATTAERGLRAFTPVGAGIVSRLSPFDAFPPGGIGCPSYPIVNQGVPFPTFGDFNLSSTLNISLHSDAFCNFFANGIADLIRTFMMAFVIIAMAVRVLWDNK